MHDLGATLVGVATPPGRGGGGCVRVSGPAAEAISRGLFRAETGDREPRPGRRPCFGRFLSRRGHELDHGYLVLFAAGASFTGELTAELWPHGSPTVLAELVAAAVEAGATPAGPGEFTYRALRNGRLDLARAEAVRDLVESRTLFQARVAFAQARGELSLRLAPLREMLEEWIARGEAAVEFVDESETHLPPGRLQQAIAEARATCDGLLEGFRTGRVVREGATLAMVGRPNAGKSSLFNRLLDRERAIVTEVAGTTRDTLEEQLDLGGIPVRLIDTAGLRDVDDPIESEGVRRAEQAREQADLVLIVLDGSRELERSERQWLERCNEPAQSRRTVVVLNKCDLPEASRCLPEGSPFSATAALPVSALTGEGLGRLRDELRTRLVGSGPLEAPVMTDSRHAAALTQAAASLEQAAEAARVGLSEEMLVEDLRQGLHHLGTITGEFTTDQLYDRIFSTFCIGK